MEAALQLVSEFVILSSLAVEQLDFKEIHMYAIYRRHIYDQPGPNFNVTKYQKGENYTGVKLVIQ
jgi:hypothetical protein